MPPPRSFSADPRLTAFALGELDGAEGAEVEAALRADPALRAEVEAIRACATAMESALASETAAESGGQPAPAESRPRRSRTQRQIFPLAYYITGGLAAAGFAVLVALNRDEITEKERRRVENLRSALEQRADRDRRESLPTIVALELTPEAVAGAGVRKLESPFAASPLPRQSREAFALTPDFGRAAYATLRRYLDARQLPPAETVRPAELLNAFSYRVPAPPAEGSEPLAAAIEVGDAPWAADRRLVRIGFRGRDVVLAEARQGILDGIARTQATIAREVRIQVEFNPAQVAGYRLIGREGDVATRESPVDDLATAGEMIAGQAFTALYEIVPAAARAGVEATGSRPAASSVLDASASDLLTVRLHYAEPAGAARRKLEFSLADGRGETVAASADFRMAAAVAEFAQVLKAAPAGGAAALRELLNRTEGATVNPADDPDGRRGEFLELVRKAQSLME